MVKQFTINLNREEGFAQREERKKLLRERVVTVVLTLFLAATVFITYQNDNEFRTLLTEKKAQLNNIIAEIDSLQNAGQNVSKEDVLALARLDKNRVLWTKKFVSVAERLPEEMAITRLEFDRGVFKIHAMSQIRPDEREFHKVKELMDRLKATPSFMEDLKSIKFSESKRMVIDEQEILSLVIACDVRITASNSKTRSSRSRSRKKSEVDQKLGS
jgi:Tfp pilus assembly protein PilN